MASSDRIALELLASWKHNVPKFAWDNFRVDLEGWQAKGGEYMVAKPKVRVGFQAAVGVGKSTELAIGGWHFMSTNGDQRTHRGKFPNGYALSISGDNLKSGLWKELGVWYERSPFLKSQFEYTAEQIVHQQHPLNWWLRARSYAKSANPATQGAALSGLHSPWACVLLDEVGEMHPQVGRRAEQVLSDAECERGMILAAFNPTSLSGLGYDIATNGSGWDMVQITGDPDDPDRSKRVDIEWAREQIKKYGRDNPWVMAHILGKFPPGGLNNLLTPDEVRTAMKRNPTPDGYRWSQRRIGVDVARFGDDRTVLFPRQGVAAFKPVEMRHGRDTPVSVDIGNRVLAMKAEWGSEVEFFDDTVGWAHGAIDYCRVNGGRPIAVNFGDTRTTDPRYFNRRSEMWMKMAEWIRAEGAIPEIPELLTELCAPTYGFKGGKWILEEKDAIKERLGYSPDLADALALTFALPDQPSAMHPVGQELLRRTHQVAADYKPHARFNRR